MDEENQEIYDIIARNQQQQVQGSALVGGDADLLRILVNKDEVLEDPSVPEVIKKVMLWYNKTIALSNIKREDIFHIQENFRDARVAALMGRGRKNFTWEEEMWWSLLNNWIFIESTRGVDGFERVMQTTQISQINQDSKQQLTGSNSGGIFGMLKSKLGGGDR